MIFMIVRKFCEDPNRYCHIGAIVVVLFGILNFYILTPPSLHNAGTFLKKIGLLALLGTVIYFLPPIVLFLGNILPLLFLAFIIAGTFYAHRLRRDMNQTLKK